MTSGRARPRAVTVACARGCYSLTISSRNLAYNKFKFN